MSDLAATGGVPGPGRIGRLTIGDLLRKAARRFPQRVAVTDGERQVTFAEIERDANRFANHLVARGLRPGEKISTICNNSVEMVKAIFGINRAGLVWVPVNTVLAASEMDYILEHAEVGIAVIDDNLLAQPDRRAALEKRGLTLLPMSTFEELLAGHADLEPEVDRGDRDLAMIMYTSGTTARPKGVMHGHLAVVTAVMSNVVEMKLDRESGITGQFPLFHCTAHVMLCSFLAVGGKVALLRGFEPGACLEAMARDRLTIFLGLPMMYQAILDHPRRKELDLSSLRLGVYAMAPMPRPLLERAIAELCPNLCLMSGQTEMYPATTMARPERQLLRIGNYWGESLIANETAIMDDEGNLLPPGQAGELVHRGPNVMLGYYKDPEATAAARRFGWHHTGDLAMVDEHGEILFLDRKKDMIKSGGENVASVKVEETLMAHPAVMNAAVVGLPHPTWGEAVTGFVTLKAGALAEPADIVEHCRLRLGGFQVPKAVVILTEMPATATGKLRKVEIREKYADHYRR